MRRQWLNLIEEPLHLIAGPIKVGTEADWVFAISLRWNVGPSALLVDERPDPIGVVGAICQQYGLRLQSRQQN